MMQAADRGLRYMAAATGLLLLAAGRVAAESNNSVTIKDDPGEQIPGPAHPNDAASVAGWRASMLQWRSRMREKMHYNGSIYDVPQLKWTQTSYIQPQMHPCECAMCPLVSHRTCCRRLTGPG